MSLQNVPVAVWHNKFFCMVLLENRYWMEFDKWEVFVNDDSTRSFLSLEITGTGLQEVGIINIARLLSIVVLVVLVTTCKSWLAQVGLYLIDFSPPLPRSPLFFCPQITRQINVVNEVYRLHGLLEFYKVSFHFFYVFFFSLLSGNLNSMHNHESLPQVSSLCLGLLLKLIEPRF